MHRHSRAVILSGCSGGGKSTVLQPLAARGFATVAEPGRRIVRHELRTGGEALPWLNPSHFARRCIQLARTDLGGHDDSRWRFFDRVLVDVDTALRHHEGVGACTVDELKSYHHRVFLTPPWRALYAVDDERQLGFAEAVDEYSRLLNAYRGLAYTATVLPKVDAAQRADMILTELELI